jgi:hypothetical protein
MLATIRAVNEPDMGFYLAEIDAFPESLVLGASLWQSAFAVGEKVTAFQCFTYGNAPEFGFAKTLEYKYGSVQIPPSRFDTFLGENPHGMALGWLCSKARKNKVMFSPGIVVGFITSRGIRVGLRVQMRFTGTIANLGVIANLDINDFDLDDGVLVSHWPNAGRAVIGWWLTVKDVDPVWPDLDYQYFIGGTGTANTVIALRQISTGAFIASWTVFVIMQAREGYCSFFDNALPDFYFWFVAQNVDFETGEPPLAAGTNARIYWYRFTVSPSVVIAKLTYADYDYNTPQAINLTHDLETAVYNVFEAPKGLNSPSLLNNLVFQGKTIKADTPSDRPNQIQARALPEGLP